jgi:hypothetical protein
MSRVTEAHHELAKEVTKSQKNAKNPIFFSGGASQGSSPRRPHNWHQAGTFGVFEPLRSLPTLDIAEIRD